MRMPGMVQGMLTIERCATEASKRQLTTDLQQQSYLAFGAAGALLRCVRLVCLQVHIRLPMGPHANFCPCICKLVAVPGLFELNEMH